MPGIDQVISDRMNAFAGQPEALAQRYAQNQDLLDLLALQKMKTDKAAAMREVQASMQANPTTVRDQLNQEAMTQTRQEMAAQAMQGAQGMQLNQRRAMQARGIPTLPAPNMARRQGYQQGGIIPAEPTMGAVPPSAVGNEQSKQFAKEYMGIKKALEDPRQAEFKERNQMLLQDLIRQMGDQMPAVMQYIDSMKGMVEPRGFAGPEGSYVSGSPPVFRSEDPELLRYGQGDGEENEPGLFGLLRRVFRPSRATAEANRIERAQQEALGEQARAAGERAATFRKFYDPNPPAPETPATTPAPEPEAMTRMYARPEEVGPRTRGETFAGMLVDAARQRRAEGILAPTAANRLEELQQRREEITSEMRSPRRQYIDRLQAFLGGVADGYGGTAQALSSGSRALKRERDRQEALELGDIDKLMEIEREEQRFNREIQSSMDELIANNRAELEQIIAEAGLERNLAMARDKNKFISDTIADILSAPLGRGELTALQEQLEAGEISEGDYTRGVMRFLRTELAAPTSVFSEISGASGAPPVPRVVQERIEE